MGKIVIIKHVTENCDRDSSEHETKWSKADSPAIAQKNNLNNLNALNN
jgi:hypothetical protein